MTNSLKRLFAKGRMKSGEMNETEKKYEREILKPMLLSGGILWYKFESITFTIAECKKGCRYTPDFIIMLPDGSLEAHEVKGCKAVFRDDARVKCKVFAEQYPIPLTVCYPVRHGGWEYEQF